jgi:release factor glutamine methyltransferase
MEKEISWLLKEKYNGKPTKNFHKDILRIQKGEPLDYVIGFTKFLDCKIDLSKKPLIPRPETEFWVGQAIKGIRKIRNFSARGASRKNLRILDIFAGSGCIGLAIKKHIKASKVFFADIDNRCVGARIIKSDVFENIKGKYDYIFANPPYIPKTKKNRVQKSVLKFEPKMALFGGKDGLFYIRKFLKEAKNHLNPTGKVYMEFDSSQKGEIKKILDRFKYENYQFNRDQYNRWRWVVAS